MLRAYEPTRVRRVSVEGGLVVRIAETSLRIEEQLSEVAYTIYHLEHNGSWSSEREVHVNRWFLVQEMAALLDVSGFDVVSTSGGYGGEPVTEASWHVVCTAVAR